MRKDVSKGCPSPSRPRLEPRCQAQLPVFATVNADQLFTPSMDARPVEVMAVVKGTWFGEESLVLDLEVEGSLIRAILPQTQPLKDLPWQLLEQRGLPAAMEELLRPLASASAAAFQVVTTGIPQRLAGTLETNLLRFAQEAVANAAQHSGAAR